MYDIKPLEEQWVAYKRKQRRPFVLGGFALVVVMGASLFLVDFKELNRNLLSEFTSQPKPVVQADKLLITPAFDSLLLNEPTKRAKVALITTQGHNLIEISEAPSSEEDIELIAPPEVPSKPRVKIDLNITKTESLSAYKDVEKQFLTAPDPDNSLFLARNYYRLGKYRKAEYWALETNKIDDNIEESWLLFAKAKLKLGRREDAVAILSSYIKSSKSSKAKELLDRIKKD